MQYYIYIYFTIEENIVMYALYVVLYKIKISIKYIMIKGNNN